MAATKCNILIFFLFLFTVVTSTYARPTPGPNSSPTDFIRSCCSTTLYIDVCFNTLSAYSDIIHLDPVRLASVATNRTVDQVQSIVSYVKKLRRKSLASSELAALKDCKESLDDAADLARQSAGVMAQLEMASGEEIGWHISNAQTWLSAAMTNEDTCTDGMEELDDGPAKADLSSRVWLAKQFTSIALSLVNHLVN